MKKTIATAVSLFITVLSAGPGAFAQVAVVAGNAAPLGAAGSAAGVQILGSIRTAPPGFMGAIGTPGRAGLTGYLSPLSAGPSAAPLAGRSPDGAGFMGAIKTPGLAGRSPAVPGFMGAIKTPGLAGRSPAVPGFMGAIKTPGLAGLAAISPLVSIRAAARSSAEGPGARKTAAKIGRISRGIAADLKAASRLESAGAESSRGIGGRVMDALLGRESRDSAGGVRAAGIGTRPLFGGLRGQALGSSRGGNGSIEEKASRFSETPSPRGNSTETGGAASSGKAAVGWATKTLWTTAYLAGLLGVSVAAVALTPVAFEWSAFFTLLASGFATLGVMISSMESDWQGYPNVRRDDLPPEVWKALDEGPQYYVTRPRQWAFSLAMAAGTVLMFPAAVALYAFAPGITAGTAALGLFSTAGLASFAGFAALGGTLWGREFLVDPGSLYERALKEARKRADASGAAGAELRFGEASASMPVRDGAHWKFTFYFDAPGHAAGEPVAKAVAVDFSKGWSWAGFSSRASLYEDVAIPGDQPVESVDPLAFERRLKIAPEPALIRAQSRAPYLRGGVSVSLRVETEGEEGARALWYHFFDDLGSEVAVNAGTGDVRELNKPETKTLEERRETFRLWKKLRDLDNWLGENIPLYDAAKWIAAIGVGIWLIDMAVGFVNLLP